MKPRDYGFEAGEVLRMPSGTVMEILRVFGGRALVRFVSQGAKDSTPRLPKQTKVMACYRLEGLEKIA